MSIKTKSILWGTAAALAMALLYAGIMLLSMSPRVAGESFREFWYLILGITIGFGVQVGLWAYLRQCARRHAGALPGVSGVTSGTAMLACCAHHAADVLPVLGLSGAAIILARYQRPLLILGLSINLLGVAYMVHLLRKH